MTYEDNYRAVIGERLKEVRESMNLSAYKVAQIGGIRIDQVQAVERGSTNYTIDAFIGYIRGCDLYMFFAEKDKNPALPIDLEDIKKKSIENHPDNNIGNK